MKITTTLAVMLLATASLFAQDLPDNPAVQQTSPTMKEQLSDSRKLYQKDAAEKFFYIRTADAPAIRIHKAEFFGEEVIMYGLIVADIKVNGNKPGAPKGSELFVDEFVPAGATSALHFLLSKYVGRSVGLIPVAITSGLHLHALATGRYQ